MRLPRRTPPPTREKADLLHGAADDSVFVRNAHRASFARFHSRPPRSILIALQLGVCFVGATCTSSALASETCRAPVTFVVRSSRPESVRRLRCPPPAVAVSVRFAGRCSVRLVPRCALESHCIPRARSTPSPDCSNPTKRAALRARAARFETAVPDRAIPMWLQILAWEKLVETLRFRSGGIEAWGFESARHEL